MSDSINLPEGPDPVLNIASDISNKADNFNTFYSTLRNLVENDLAHCWQGNDYDAFKQKVEEEKPRFDDMYDILVEYATKLRNAVNDHVARVEDSTGQAKSISFS